MTEQPHFLSARPNRADTTRVAPDPLSDLLRAVKFTGAHFHVADGESLRQGTASVTPPEGMVARADHFIAIHILLSGSCLADINEQSKVLMQPGDVMIFPRGSANLVPSARDTKFVRGVLGCDARSFNPLLSSLPQQLHVACDDPDWLMQLAGKLATESRVMRPGCETVLTRMAELMFIEVLRHYVEQQPVSRTGWLAGLTDPVVGSALTMLHAHPERDWTLADLARESAASRTVLTERFARLVGIPPMGYLKRWRLRLAAERLTNGGAKVSSVGACVGYESEAAFSRAFKRETGMSPAAWRRAEGAREPRRC